LLKQHGGGQHQQLEELSDAGLTLYEIAHVKGQPTLGHVLYQIGKNDPTMQPQLLEQLDQIKPQPVRVTRSKVKVNDPEIAEKKSEVEILLERLEYAAAAAVKEAGLTFEELLVGSNEIFKKSGIDLVGHRMKVKDAIRVIHGIGWTAGSLHAIHTQPTISCEEIWGAMENMKNQIVVMGSTLKYLNNECGIKGKVKVQRQEEFNALSLQLSNLAAAAAQLKQNTQKLKEFLQSVEGKTGLKRVDDLAELLKKNARREDKINLMLIGVTVMSLAFGVKVALGHSQCLPFRNFLSS
jgi:hypothetical protein